MPDGTIVVLDDGDGMILLDFDGYIGQLGTFQSTGVSDISGTSTRTPWPRATPWTAMRRTAP